MTDQKFGWRREDSSAAPPPSDKVLPDAEAAPADKPATAVARRRILRAVFTSTSD